ncbi:hypothetical protein Moror_14172 [Moniliophthora roreri MCA 2997]|uniref:Uncharacterized protein n=1 Tax=Moniliophthora roreri (strain MCA 2997) TaxID=1381753 RepID=V2YSZ8_MONRO|nr:hypothetical protein Moror_14172 [Moniliophthora roreri MCA 2997]
MDFELQDLEDIKISPELLVSPDIVSILRSGRAPSSSDTSYIKGLHADAEKELLEHFRTLQKLGDRIGFLRKQQEVFESLILSRIRMLPPEVLALILMFAVSPSDNHFHTTANSKSRAVELGLVCAHWRKISLSTPQLWGCLSIELDSAEICKDALTPAIEMHLTRSKSASLHLDLKTRNHQDRLPKSLVLQLLFKETSRWGVVKFHTAGALSQECWEALSAGVLMPCLRELELIGSGNSSRRTSDLGPWLFRNAGNLDTLRASYCHFSREDETLFPWQCLRHLGINVSSSSSASGGNIALKALEWCSNLTRANFVLPGTPVGNYTSFHFPSLQQIPASSSSSASQKRELLVRPSLDSLSIQIYARQLSVNDNRCGLEGICEIIRSITCPALTTFAVSSNVTRKVWNDDYECTDDDHAVDLKEFCDCSVRYAEMDSVRRERWEKRQALWPQRDILDFFHRSKCRLTSLRLKGVWISDSELLGLLREVGAMMTELVVHEVVGNNSFAERKVITRRLLKCLIFVRVEEARRLRLEETENRRRKEESDGIWKNFWEDESNPPVPSRRPTPPPVEIDLDAITSPIVILPRLHHLELKLANSFSWMDTLLLQRMVRSRWWVDNPLCLNSSEIDRLQSVVFVLPEADYTFAMDTVWRTMKAEGLAIKVRTEQKVLLGNNGEEEEWDRWSRFA